MSWGFRAPKSPLMLVPGESACPRKGWLLHMGQMWQPGGGEGTETPVVTMSRRVKHDRA